MSSSETPGPASSPARAGRRVLGWKVLTIAGLLWLCTYRQHRRDPLTRLWTRAQLRMRLSAPHPPMILALIAVNRLKLLNEQQGRRAGDRWLRRVAKALKTALPSGTILARWDGDTFLTALTGATLQRVDQQLCQVSSELPMPFPGQPALIHGLAYCRTAGEFQQALEAADHALYLAKGDGTVSSQAMGEERGLFDFSRHLEQLDTPEEILRRGLHLARELLQFEIAAYFTVHGDTMVGQYVDAASPEAGARIPLHVPLSISKLGHQSIQERRTVTDIDLDVVHDSLASPIWKRLGAKSAIMTPVDLGDHAIGLLGMAQLTEPKIISLRSQRVLELAALRLGHALELQATVLEVRRTLEGGLLGLGAALEARDLETSGHTARVVRYSTALGRALQMNHLALDELRQGAYLHDIGKLSIPDRILLKPGPLDPAEWKVMRSHVESGASIAARIPQLSYGALAVIQSHHERWDGQGYPAGLQGDSIPLLARIFMVADTYDALTSDRPYKRAWTVEAARQELVDQAGRQLDPQIVAAFLSLSEVELSAITE